MSYPAFTRKKARVDLMATSFITSVSQDSTKRVCSSIDKSVYRDEKISLSQLAFVHLLCFSTTEIIGAHK